LLEQLTRLVDQHESEGRGTIGPVKTVKVQEAKTYLSALLVEVEKGSVINIARGERTIARLVPVDAGERELGFGGYRLPDTFFDELPGEELRAWEGA
jgi:antitoxin of toxin-antitoxin stability system